MTALRQRLGLSATLVGLALTGASASDRGWPAIGGGPDNARFSPLTEIKPSNLAQLGGAWVHPFENETSRATPLVADGKMFVTAGAHVYALDPQTGREICERQTPRRAVRPV